MRSKSILVSILVVGLLLVGASAALARSMKTPADTFVWDVYGPPESIDPGMNDSSVGERVLRSVYGTLVMNGPQGDEKLYPGLAESWEVAEDGQTFVFHLRQGVKFHNGNPFTADDVVFSFERAIGIGRIPGQKLDEIANIETVEKVDKYTVKIVTADPSPSLLRHVAGTPASIIDKEWALEHGDEGLSGEPAPYISTHANGTGPYKLVEHKPREFFRFERYEDYWNGWDGEHVDEVRLRIVPEYSTRLMELLSGNADYIDVSKSNISDVQGIDGVKLDMSGLGNYILLVWLNTETEFLQNEKVRQALNYSFPYDRILNVAFRGTAVELDSVIGKTVYDYPKGVEWYDYDMDKAKQLLEEAGYGDGYSEPLTMYYDTGRSARKKLGLIWKQELAKLGITLNVRAQDWPVMAEKVSVGDFSIYASGIWSTYPAASGYTYQFKSSASGSGGNYAFLKNEELDELIDKAKTELEVENRVKTYRKVHDRVKELAPVIAVNQNSAFQVYGEWLKGVEYYPWGQLRFYDVYKEG
ncbi:ABC transporter substrate-binding protein [Candidatus Bipolaricaulota bacterium]|nr:ABC transporter substrate-binding protein [Candidatus Bipolaricaulota bacterium]